MKHDSLMNRRAASFADLLEIVESAYQVDLPDQEWLKGLTETARPHLDEGFGLATFEFYRPEGGDPQIVDRCYLGIPEGLAQVYPEIFATMAPAIRKRPFELGPCVTGSQLMGMRDEFRDQPHMKKYLHAFGAYDTLWVTAAEPSGRGCGFHAGRSKIAWATASQVAKWGRVAAHVSTAVRLRRRLMALRSQDIEPPPDAVLDPNGKVHDASGDAKEDAVIARLRHAVVELERIRGPTRRLEPDKALAGWKGLVAGRWSLLDRIEHDGRRYIVARENVPSAAGPKQLTAREKQVLQCAKLGHHNKLIAYELGIADSTVRVLITRAAHKLGVRGREDLLRAFSE